MPKKANPDRGEHDLVLAGKSYRLRPSITAIRAIERELDKSTLALIRLGRVGELTLDQLGVATAELIRAGAAPDDEMAQSVDAERISELIFETGLPDCQTRVTLCLLDAATGGREASGEAKAAPAKATKPPAGAASRE